LAGLTLLATAACGFLRDTGAGDEGAGAAAVGDSLAGTAVDTLREAADSATAPDTAAPMIGVSTDSALGPAASSPGLLDQDSLAGLLRELAAGQAALAARLDQLDAGMRERSEPPDSARSRGAPSQVIGEAGEHVRSFGVGVVWSILVVLLFHYLIRGTTWVLDTLAERTVARRLFYKRLVPLVRIILWIFAAYLIVRVIFRVEAQGILAAAAAVGVAVGFAAQDLLKNLFGGIILVFDQPFQVGDKIRVGDTYGEVVSIGLRSTRLVTPDDNLVSVPNAQVVDDQVANANAGELNCQVVTDLYLPGFVDESKAKKIAFDAAVTSKYVFLNKPIAVLIKDDFKETFLTRIRVKAYVLDPRYEFLFQSDVTERARAGFREAGLMDAGHGLRAYLDLGRVHAPPGEGPHE
jgi:small-conductance mechanosensitive channel